MLFQFCCLVPVILSKKKSYFRKFSNLGLQVGLLFQIIDDIIDFKGNSKIEGKKTKKDQKKGKATLISLLGYENTVNYSNKLKKNIFKQINSFHSKANDFKETINFVLSRGK